MRLSHHSRSLVVLGASAVLVLGSLLVATAASGEDEPSAPPAAAAPKHRGGAPGPGMMFGGFDADALSAQIGRLPEALRDDLAEILTTDDDADRAKLIEALKSKAEAGEYGDDVKSFVDRGAAFGKRMHDRGARQWSDLPPALKDDLAALKGLDRDERKAAMAKIVKKAKAGGYGADVKQQAERWGRFGGAA